ncbi:hypothetical protein HPB48_004860 [Haemaphysalis longicornis]|uniref:Sulfotransferase n=1 Tax=Haemaphysalis longicornis TaxID=44386 RepID=A0A9J6GSL8_HAELO|nr:hypothetical protein HPB48_004860 [Haemaphysalis longicornis]
MTAARPKPYYQVVDGVPRCPLIAPELLREGFDFVPEKGDLLQVSYPKSGTHWVQYITQLILRKRRTSGESRRLQEKRRISRVSAWAQKLQTQQRLTHISHAYTTT